MKSNNRTIRFLLVAMVALVVSGFGPATAGADFGVTSFSGEVLNEAGEKETRAGAHPHTATTEFHLETTPGSEGEPLPAESMKFTHVELPPGLIGNPQAVPKCTRQAFGDWGGGSILQELCPRSTQIGQVTLFETEQTLVLPIWNLEPPPGLPAQFAFRVLTTPVYLNPELRSDGDYGITIKVDNINQSLPIIGSRVTLWGVPADSAHDPVRGICTEIDGTTTGELCPSQAPRKPFISNPTDCSTGPLTTTLHAGSWYEPSDVKTASFVTEPGPQDCDELVFEPSITVTPKSPQADAPSGYDLVIDVPQDENPDGRATPQLRSAKITLPQGVTVNSSAANGLDACTEAQISIATKQEPACPAASKIGEVTVDTPLLEDPMLGELYVAKQRPDQLLGLYLVARGPGILIKLRGDVEADPQTGQLTTTFAENPPLPFARMHVELYGGERAALSNPPTCGVKTVTTELTPNSAAPQFGSGEAPRPPATPSDQFAITVGADGRPCAGSEAALPFAPAFMAGTLDPVAGAYSPLSVRVLRGDGEQELERLTVSLPQGLTGKLAGIPYCPDGALAAIDPMFGSGGRELATPSCPAQSQVGRVVVGTGSGSSPFYVQTGRAYLAGPYKGAPVSMAFTVPALAGPFDLGTTLVRAALHVDPRTTQITAVSDPLPRILHGIPVKARDIRILVDRPQMTRNPTSCDPMAVDAVAHAYQGAAANLSDRFQVGDCAALGFRPRLALRLLGPTKRAKHPRLRATLTTRSGNANLSRVSVRMPRSAFLAQEHIRTVCTRVQFAADACPAGSIYGRAAAVTPLLDYPLEGPVYLRSSNNPLPDLVAALRGPAHQPIEVELSGRTDSVKGSLRNTFDFVPDAPVSKFTLELFGGKRGLIVNSQDLCDKQRHRATIRVKAQNGDVLSMRPAVKNACGKGPRR